MKMKNQSQKSNHLINSITVAVVVVVLLITSATKAVAQKKEKLLGEKQFDIELTEQGKKKTPEPAKDQLLFRAEKISSAFMMKEYTFTASAYTATVDSTSGAPVVTFESDSKNTDGDKLKWSGTLTGETMEGTAVITDKKGKAKASYTFTGKQKKFRGK